MVAKSLFSFSSNDNRIGLLTDYGLKDCFEAINVLFSFDKKLFSFSDLDHRVIRRDDSGNLYPRIYAPKIGYMPQKSDICPKNRIYAPKIGYMPQKSDICPKKSDICPKNRIYAPKSRIYAPKIGYLPQKANICPKIAAKADICSENQILLVASYSFIWWVPISCLPLFVTKLVFHIATLFHSS